MVLETSDDKCVVVGRFLLVLDNLYMLIYLFPSFIHLNHFGLPIIDIFDICVLLNFLVIFNIFIGIVGVLWVIFYHGFPRN